MLSRAKQLIWTRSSGRRSIEVETVAPSPSFDWSDDSEVPSTPTEMMTPGISLSTRMQEGRVNTNHSRGSKSSEMCALPESTCRVPYETVETIIAHLSHDLDDLKACSLTCRSWYTVAVPHIQHTLILGRGATPSGLKRLSELYALGLAPLVKEIRVEQWGGASTWFTPQAFRGHVLSHFSAFANVHTLKLQHAEIHQFIPGIEHYFGHFSQTLRSFTLYDPCCSPRQLSHILSLFPNLDDVEICRVSIHAPGTTIHDSELVPSSAPKFRGRLALYGFGWAETWTNLISSCGGIRFRHMDLRGSASCVPVLLEACAETLETLQLYSAYCLVRTRSLSFPEFDLSQLKTLRSLQLRDWTTGFGPASSIRHAAFMEVFSTIASPLFSELVLEIKDDEIVYLPLEVGLFKTLRVMNGTRPFKLVFLLEAPDSSKGEAWGELAWTLDLMIQRGLLDFFDSPPIIR